MESLFAEYVADRSREAETPSGSFTGAAGGAACGDLARISLTVENGRIASAVFGTEGCAATRAACACVCEMVERQSVVEAPSSGQSLLKSCASADANYYAALGASGINAAFSGIVNSINKLRLTH